MAKKFDYMSIEKGNLGTGDNRLKQLGQEGWELAGINPNSGGSDYNVYVFKREIESPITRKQEYSHEIER